jgi:hypothetical protein
VRPFSAVPELLRRVRDEGLRIAIGSSAKKEELDKYLEIVSIGLAKAWMKIAQGERERQAKQQATYNRLLVPSGTSPEPSSHI